jgi:hypothetical protein
VQTVIRTSVFLADAQRAGLSEEEQMIMVSAISREPTLGELMVGTGGCRKVRFPGKGKGKSGGYRTIHYFAGADVPILLLALIDKGVRDNLIRAERNELREALASYAEEYRKGARTLARSGRRRR